MRYGVEIWGWEEREGMERLEEGYLRWVLRINRKMPSYLLREELQRHKLRGRARRRAWGFEKRLSEGKGSEMARKCWEEMKERFRKGKVKSSWERERRSFLRTEIKIEEERRG